MESTNGVCEVNKSYCRASFRTQGTQIFARIMISRKHKVRPSKFPSPFLVSWVKSSFSKICFPACLLCQFYTSKSFHAVLTSPWYVSSQYLIESSKYENQAFVKSNKARHALRANCLSICLRGCVPKHVAEPISRAHGQSGHASPHHRNHDACFSLPWTRCPVAFHYGEQRGANGNDEGD